MYTHLDWRVVEYILYNMVNSCTICVFYLELLVGKYRVSIKSCRKLKLYNFLTVTFKNTNFFG